MSQRREIAGGPADAAPTGGGAEATAEPGAEPAADGSGRWPARGLWIGALAALWLWSIETLALSLQASEVFDDVSQQLLYLRYTLGQLLGAGALIGALGGALAMGVDRALARWCPTKRRATATAILVTTIATPPALALSAALLEGRRARALPAHGALVVGGAAAVVVAALGLLALLRLGRAGSRRALAIAGVLLGAAAGAWIADRLVLARLYPAFHHGLGVVEAVLATAGAGLLLRDLGLPRPALLRRLGLPLAVAALLLGWSLRQMGWWPALRAVAFEHALVEPRLLLAVAALRPGPRAAAPLVPPAPDPRPEAAQAPPLPPGPRLPPGDVVLITVDAMRADRLAPATAPRLRALADGGVDFTAAYAQVPHTSFSVATLLTGKYVSSLAALGVAAGTHETLADVFQRERWKTAAFFPPAVFYIDHEQFAELERTAYHFEYVRYEYKDAEARTDEVIRFLERERPDRAFVWVHYFEPHEPYVLHGAAPRGPPPDAAARYDGEVRYVDAAVGRLADWLTAHRPGGLLAFTADHGEEFGEHGGRYHGSSLYEEQVRVPLFLARLGGAPALPPHRVSGPVALVDLAPTLLALHGIMPSARMRGIDLGPWLSATPPPSARLPAVHAEIGTRKLLAEGRDRLVCDLAREFCQLYNLDEDPGEKHDRSSRDPARAAALRQDLDRWLADQATYERGAPTDPAEEPLLRGRQGDLGAAPALAALLGPGTPHREEAAATLLALPDAPAAHEALGRAGDADPEDLVLAVLALRAGVLPPARLGPTLARLGGPDAPLRAQAEAALALAATGDRRALPLLLEALPRSEDEELSRRLIGALGRSHNPRALRPLLGGLLGVRTRLDVVRALGELGDRRAAGPLLRRIGREAYVPVRAEMARALGHLDPARARGPLLALRRRETEQVVRAAIDEGLAARASSRRPRR